MAHPLGRKGAPESPGGGTGENGGVGSVGKVENDAVLIKGAGGRPMLAAARRRGRAGVGAWWGASGPHV